MTLLTNAVWFVPSSNGDTIGESSIDGLISKACDLSGIIARQLVVKTVLPWTQDEYKISDCEIKDKHGAH
jgi:hypothetical protein